MFNKVKELLGFEKRGMNLQSRDAWESILGPGTSSGKTVTPRAAMSIPAALSAIRLLSESVAGLPIALYRKDKQGGREKAQEHPLHRLLHRNPNELQTAFQFKEVLMLGLLTNGNGYALIDWADNGQPKNLWPIEPSRVGIDQDPNTGRVTYKVSTGTGQVDLPPEEILHIPGLCFDGLRGYSIIFAAREALGSAISELEHGGTFFKNSSRPAGVLEHPEAMSEEGYRRLKESWNSQFEGSKNAHRTAILEQGTQFKPVSLSNKDSQWLESRAFSVKEVARIFRVPPHLLGDLERASYSSIEAQNMEYLQYTLRPWLARIEQAINLKLLTPREQKNYYAEFLTADFLRGDTQSRFAAYEVALRSGWMSINEVRERENLPPVDNGETHFVQLNTAPLDKAVQGQEQSPEPAPEPRKVETRARVRDSARDQLERAIRGLLEEEQSSILSQIDENTSEEQLKEIIEQYYGERPEAVKDKMQNLFQSIIRRANRLAASRVNAEEWSLEEVSDFSQKEAEEFSGRHVGIGLTMALGAASQAEPVKMLKETFEQALDTRPGKAAEIESTKVESDTTMETYEKAGIERLVWRTEPDACDFCKQLDGRVVGLGEAFVQIGEEIPGPGGQADGLKARAPRVSPPLHLGCQCSIEPVTGV